MKKLDDVKVYMTFYYYDCDVVPQRVVCRLENLFSGNKVLGKLPDYEY
jgi:hypothetical protein